MNIVFILPVSGGGGGAHSVMQEANELILMGVNVHVAVNEKNYLSLKVNYSDMPAVTRNILSFQSVSELVEKIPQGSIVCGTIFTSIKILKQIIDERIDITPAYYVQDYEPLFCKEYSELWEEARRSYTLIPNLNIFTKTEWQQNIVFKNHGVKVSKVEPSLDHSTYYPKLEKTSISICAMIRPHSLRRAPKRTMRILRAVKLALPGVNVNVFGCNDNEFVSNNLVSDFDFINHGVLKRQQVAELLRDSTIFLDASDFQAFGRTGLEAMSCGCIPVLTAVGGVYEYARNNVDSLIMDMNDESSVADEMVSLLNENVEKRHAMMVNAVNRAQDFSIRRAALSELFYFSKITGK